MDVPLANIAATGPEEPGGSPSPVADQTFSLVSHRRPYMRYSHSYQSFSFVIVAPRALILKRSLSAKLWTWVEPFSSDLWIVLACSVVFSGLIFYLLELETNAEANDFEHFKRQGATRHHLALGHSLYLSALAVTTTGDHTPTTFPARCAVAAAPPPYVARPIAIFRARCSNHQARGPSVSLLQHCCGLTRPPVPCSIYTLCKTFTLWVVMAACADLFAPSLLQHATKCTFTSPWRL